MIYEAIMKAADHIEAFPKEFRFSTTAQPSKPNCGTPGCALGWIATFAGYTSGRRSFGALARDLLKVPCDPSQDGDQEFYNRMEALGGNSNWQIHASECARVLRLYAAEYHTPAHTGLPAIVREIFTKPSQTIPDDGRDTVLTSAKDSRA